MKPDGAKRPRAAWCPRWGKRPWSEASWLPVRATSSKPIPSFPVSFRVLAKGNAKKSRPRTFLIEENETTFTIDWKGSYRIEGAAFVYMDRETGRLATIHGYPTHKLIQMR
jgi:hypothetical protein